MTTTPIATYLACLALVYCLMVAGGVIGWVVDVGGERSNDDG